jgi:hypothetical protein
MEVIISHLYIERRLVPLNLFLMECLAEADTKPERRAAMERAILEYGNAIKDLVATNIFPGDMLWKNFGVTRGGKVVFYDYDEIEYLTDCNFREVPQPRTEEEEMSGDIWYSVGPRDVFPRPSALFCWAIRPCATSSCAITPICWRPSSGAATRAASVTAISWTCSPTSAAAFCMPATQAWTRSVSRFPPIASLEEADHIHPFFKETNHASGSRRHRQRRPHSHGRVPGRFFRSGRP